MGPATTGSGWPLREFLEALQGEGAVVDLRAEEAVARLVLRWREMTRDDLRAALAALLGPRLPGDAAEGVERVAAAFDRYFPVEGAAAVPDPDPNPNPNPNPVRGEPVEPPPATRRRGWALAAAALSLFVLALSILWPWRPSSLPRPTDLAVDAGELGCCSPPPADLGPAPPDQTSTPDLFEVGLQGHDPDLPPAPIVYPTTGEAARAPVGVTLLVFLLALVIFQAARSGRVLLARAMVYYTQLLEKLAGPAHYRVPLPTAPPPLSGADMDEIATLLCRVCVDPPRGRWLDVPRTVRDSAARGYPVLHLTARGAAATLLVLVDHGSETRPYLRKSYALLDGLAARGVPQQRWFFDGDAEHLQQRTAAGEGGPLWPLAEVLRTRPLWPVLIISTGQGAEGSVGQPAGWLRALAALPARAWLHPVADPELWRAELNRLLAKAAAASRSSSAPLRAWPLSRVGLRGVAYDLAADPAGRLRIPRDRLRPRRLVDLQGDVPRMHELLALWPGDPDLEQADWLRRCGAPDIPEEVLRLLLRGSESATNGVLKLQREVLQRALLRLRRRDKAEELRLRWLIFARLKAAEPQERDSQAHLRWRKDRSWAALYLDDDALREEALRDLEELAAGALWEEIDEDRWRLDKLPLPPPVMPRIERGVLRILARQAGGALPKGAEVGFGRSLLAGLRWFEPALALLPALLVALGLLLALRQRLPHRRDYRLHATSGALTLEVVGEDPQGAPPRAALFQDGREVGAIVVGEEVDLEPARAARSYHAIAALPSGQRVYSPLMVVPGAQPLTRLQVAVRDGAGRDLPEATCALRGAGARVCSLRTLMSVLPGAWEVSGEAPGFKAAQQQITLREGESRQVTLTLEKVAPQKGRLRISLALPGVEPGDVRVGRKTWDGTAEQEWPPGAVTVSVVHPYYALVKSARVVAGELTTVSLTGPPTHGLALLVLEPADAMLRLPPVRPGEEGLKVSARSGGRVTLRGVAGSYALSATAPRHQDLTLTVPIQVGVTAPQETLTLLPVQEPPTPTPVFPPAIVWKRVTAAPFIMGADDLTEDERPRHREESVTRDFAMMETEVTVAMYQACVAAGKCGKPRVNVEQCNFDKPDKTNHPMNCVEYKEAAGFCAALGGRLPNEAEWELAARGTDGREYPWGAESPEGRACFGRRYSQGTCPSGQYRNFKSPFGLLDMSGNVWEWTSSSFCQSPYPYKKKCSDLNTRAVRGGSFYLVNQDVRAASRDNFVTMFNDLGFRCAKLP